MEIIWVIESFIGLFVCLGWFISSSYEWLRREKGNLKSVNGKTL